MNAAEKARFDIDLAPAELKEETIDRQNAEQMQRLIGDRKMPRPVPLKDRKRKQSVE